MRREGTKRLYSRLADPEIHRRASLSRRHGRETDDDGDDASGQHRLDEF